MYSSPKLFILLLYVQFAEYSFASANLSSLYGLEFKPVPQNLDVAPQVKLPVELKLKSSRIEINVSRLFLGDIYDCNAFESVCDEISGIDLGEAPEPGRVSSVRGDDLATLVAERLGQSYNINIVQQEIVALHSKTQTLDQSFLVSSIEEQLRQKFSNDDLRINIKSARLKKSVKLRPGNISIELLNVPSKISELFSSKSKRILSRLELSAEVTTDFAGFAETVPVDLIITFEIKANVYIANQMIPAGKILRSAFFDKNWLTISKMPIFEFKYVESKKLTRRMQVGDYLVVGVYDEPTVINRGDEIDIILVNGRLQIKRKGKALNHARLGDDVKVRLDDNRKLKGVAISKSTVRISM